MALTLIRLGGAKRPPPPRYILLYAFLVIHPNFMKLGGDFS